MADQPTPNGLSVFYSGLNDGQKSLLESLGPVNGGEAILQWPHRKSFEKEVLPHLLPEQQREWVRLKEEMQREWEGLKKHGDGEYAPLPKDHIKSVADLKLSLQDPVVASPAPSLPLPRTVLQPSPVKLEVPAVAPERAFEHSLQKPGHYTFQEDVEHAQRLMKDLKRLTGEDGIDLGHTGPNKDGIDGLFGSRTLQSVRAAEKLLGIDPPTGKITQDFMKKLEHRVAALGPESGPVISRVEPLATVSASIPSALPMSSVSPVSEDDAVLRLPPVEAKGHSMPPALPEFLRGTLDAIGPIQQAVAVQGAPRQLLSDVLACMGVEGYRMPVLEPGSAECLRIEGRDGQQPTSPQTAAPVQLALK